MRELLKQGFGQRESLRQDLSEGGLGFIIWGKDSLLEGLEFMERGL